MLGLLAGASGLTGGAAGPSQTGSISQSFGGLQLPSSTGNMMPAVMIAGAILLAVVLMMRKR